VPVSWSHRGRCRSEAAFAALAGVSPLEAASGRITCHRLNRFGDRELNGALHVIINWRMRGLPAGLLEESAPLLNYMFSSCARARIWVAGSTGRRTRWLSGIIVRSGTMQLMTLKVSRGRCTGWWRASGLPAQAQIRARSLAPGLSRSVADVIRTGQAKGLIASASEVRMSGDARNAGS
jgi:hypothetical protein